MVAERLDTETRQGQIKKAVLDIISTEGIGKLLIRNLASKIGLTEGALFRHFSSKKEIMLSILDDVKNELLAEQERITFSSSKIPEDVRKDIIDIVLNATDDELFTVTVLKDFKYSPVKGSFNKAKCEICGEYVFERYLRVKDGKKVCITCSERTEEETIIHLLKIG